MPSPRSFTRRDLLAASAALPLLGHAGPLRATEAKKTGAAGPLKIALLTSLTGPFQSLGESMRAGLELFLAGQKHEIAGRRVELLVEDDHGKPDEALRKVQKLISRDRIDLLCGIIPANIALAIRDTVHEAKLPTFVANAAANALARSATSPWIFRVTKTSWMLGHTGARWVHEKIEKSGGVTLASDYAAGREYVGDFIDTFRELGGSMGESLWTPLGTSDFAPLIMKMAAAQPRFIYCFLAGADAVRFHKQMKTYGMQGRLPLVGPGALFDQEDVVLAAGDATLGGISTFHQSPGAAASADFVKAYTEARGRLPGEASTSGHVSGQVMKAAIEAVEGDTSRFQAMKDFLLGNVVDTAFGPMAFDPRNNQAILDIYVNEVRKGPDGKPLNSVLHTYKAVQDPGPAK